MLISFFESVKYMGHLWPIALFRMGIGYYFLLEGFKKLNSGFLESSWIAEVLTQWWNQGVDPEKISFVQNWFLPNWQILNYFFLSMQFFLALSYLTGFLVRPSAVIAILTSGLTIYFTGHVNLEEKLLLATNLLLLLTSAGRCIGFDYYFYKRTRKIWW